MKAFYVLLAEDNSDLRSLFVYILMREGFVVKDVEDGEAALNALFEQMPDAVVTDLNMPKMDGLELIKQIRNREELRGLPVIAMTAYGENMLLKAKDVGATRVIAKPLDNQLCSELHSLLVGPPQTW